MLQSGPCPSHRAPPPLCCSPSHGRTHRPTPLTIRATPPYHRNLTPTPPHLRVVVPVGDEQPRAAAWPGARGEQRLQQPRPLRLGLLPQVRQGSARGEDAEAARHLRRGVRCGRRDTRRVRQREGDGGGGCRMSACARSTAQARKARARACLHAHAAGVRPRSCAARAWAPTHALARARRVPGRPQARAVRALVGHRWHDGQCVGVQRAGVRVCPRARRTDEARAQHGFEAARHVCECGGGGKGGGGAQVV